MLKGVLAMALGFAIARGAGQETGVVTITGGILAVVGHNYSLFLRFQGGKGIATSLPVLFHLSPLLVVVWVGGFFLAVAGTRLLVLGQILGTLAVPIAAAFFLPGLVVPAGILALLVFVRHAPRLRNVFNGTEPKLYYKVDKSSGS